MEDQENLYGSVFEGTLVECRRYLLEKASEAVEKGLSVKVLSGGEVFGQLTLTNPEGPSSEEGDRPSEITFQVVH